MLPLVLAGAVTGGAHLAVQLAATSMGFSWKTLTPDFKRLNPLSQAQRAAAAESPGAAAGGGHAAAVRADGLLRWRATTWPPIWRCPFRRLESACCAVADSLQALLWKAPVLFVVFGAVDLFRQQRRYRKDLRMSKQEIRDESRKRRQSADQGAHPADAARHAAAQHDAGGSDGHRGDRQPDALRGGAALRAWTPWPRRRWWPRARTIWRCASAQKAIENQVPIIENPPLAQALYKSVDVGQEIPPHLYRAVAEILAYIYKLMNGRMPGITAHADQTTHWRKRPRRPGSSLQRSPIEPLRRTGRAAGGAGDRDGADHAAAPLPAGLPDRGRHHDVGHRADGRDVHHASRWSSASFPPRCCC